MALVLRGVQRIRSFSIPVTDVFQGPNAPLHRATFLLQNENTEADRSHSWKLIR